MPALQPYAIDSFEFTNARFARFASACLTSADLWGDWELRPGDGGYLASVGRESFPARYVTYDQAAAACAYEGKTLCNASQWSRACAGDGGFVYPWGNDAAPAACNGAGSWPDGGASPRAVGAMTTCEGAWPGVYDMAGNVAEWTSEMGRTHRITRGGSFMVGVAQLACDQTVEAAEATQSEVIGFRCCKVPP